MKNKSIYIISGGIAAGKSTLSYNFINHFNLENLPFVSTDVYYSKFFLNDDQFEKYYDKARKFTDERLELYIKNEESFVWETVLSKDKKRKFIEKCKNEGYEIVCLFVGLNNAEEAIKRSKARHLEGDHFVAEEFISDRHKKSIEALKWISNLADTLVVFDNSEMLKLLVYKSESESFLADTLPEWVGDII